MAKVPYSNYTGNGTTTQYAVPFAFQNKSDVSVYVSGSLVTNYIWANADTIQFNAAPANAAPIIFVRQTSVPAIDTSTRRYQQTELLPQALYALEEIQAPVPFAALPASPVPGQLATVVDSTLATWGSTIAGGGSNNVLARWNGTHWTVVGA